MSVVAAATPLTVTLDLERHRADAAGARYRDNAARILDFLTARGVRATVFVVGELVAELAPLLRAADAAGHELALHSHAHLPLTEERPARFRARLGDCRARLSDTVGRAPAGFRAPVFSLTPRARWACEALVELGFAYSSSVLPSAHPLHGYPGAPGTPFRWPAGLLELPVPLARAGALALPFLGGIYLRYLPPVLVAHWRRRLAPGTLAWSYVHPYDIDDGEGY